jgi:hypothetical protein
VDVYRPLAWADCAAIARHYNRNLRCADPLWCAGGAPWDARRVWAHRRLLALRGRGRSVAEVHEVDGRVHSYFGGYERGARATYSLGVVDLDLPEPMDTWRRDSAHAFDGSLRRGVDEFRVTASSDRARYVGWMEREVGMRRLEGTTVWVACGATMQKYVAAQLGR